MIVVEMRVFPFSFPPIPGGAQGGVSPTPTPDPTPDPTPKYYDFTDAAIGIIALNDPEVWSTNDDITMLSPWEISISGVVTVDSSAVSSVSLDLSDLEFTDNGTPLTDTYVSSPVTFTGAQVNDINRTPHITIKSATATKYNLAACTGGDIVVNVYDSNGDVIQTETITVAVS